jgi:sulfite oxidase
MQCAGNRRAEMSAIKPISGAQWTTTAIGNAEWTGIRLKDVLEQAGVKDSAKHVWFTGLDDVDHKGETIHFGGSIPLEKALEPETLLAYAMNGETLTPEHGFPLRTVVPGYIGARSVKWLATIEVADRPSDNHFVAEAYKIFPPEVNADNVDWTRQEPLYELPVNAAIATPFGEKPVKPGPLRVEGWVFPSGTTGNRVAAVEVSVDGGKTWQQASFSGPELPFCWRLWEAEVEVTSSTKEIIACATDSSGQMMPENPPWNFKGYHYNAWHRMPVRVS